MNKAWIRAKFSTLSPRDGRCCLPFLCAVAIVANARGAEAEPAAIDAPPAPPPPSAPYSLPFQLRPAAATTAVRLDTAFAFYEDPVSHENGSTVVVTFFRR